MWEGLHSLELLFLSANHINTIHPAGISNLPNIKLLALHSNDLTTLPEDMFDAGEFPDSNGHPAELELGMEENPLHCDSRMCWIKEGDEEGWIISQPWNVRYCEYPGAAWKDVDLNCWLQ